MSLLKPLPNCLFCLFSSRELCYTRVTLHNQNSTHCQLSFCILITIRFREIFRKQVLMEIIPLFDHKKGQNYSLTRLNVEMFSMPNDWDHTFILIKASISTTCLCFKFCLSSLAKMCSSVQKARFAVLEALECETAILMALKSFYGVLKKCFNFAFG